MKLAEEIRRFSKHQGHNGPLGGCPICNRSEEDDEVEKLLAEEEEPELKAEEEPNPAQDRLSRIFKV